MHMDVLFGNLQHQQPTASSLKQTRMDYPMELRGGGHSLEATLWGPPSADQGAMYYIWRL